MTDMDGLGGDPDKGGGANRRKLWIGVGAAVVAVLVVAVLITRRKDETEIAVDTEPLTLLIE